MGRVWIVILHTPCCFSKSKKLISVSLALQQNCEKIRAIMPTSCNIKPPCSPALKLFNTWRHTSPTQNNTGFVAQSFHMYSRNRTCLFTVSSTQAACQKFKMVYRMCVACNSILVSLKLVDCYLVWRFLCLKCCLSSDNQWYSNFFIHQLIFHFNGFISSHNNLAHAKGAASIFT